MRKVYHYRCYILKDKKCTLWIIYSNEIDSLTGANYSKQIKSDHEENENLKNLLSILEVNF